MKGGRGEGRWKASWSTQNAEFNVYQHYLALRGLLSWLLAFFSFCSDCLPHPPPPLLLVGYGDCACFPNLVLSNQLRRTLGPASFHSWPPWEMSHHSLQSLGSKSSHFGPIASVILCLHRQLPCTGKEGQRAMRSDRNPASWHGATFPAVYLVLARDVAGGGRFCTKDHPKR